MSGFDNGTVQQGVFAQAKQFGSILFGTGEPVPTAGVVGDVYIDTQTQFLYAKRTNGQTNPWGNYLFAVPVTYQGLLKWFSSARPTNDVGADGDYCLRWAGGANYGLQPNILGPKAAGAWPGASVAVAVALNPLYTAENEHAV